LKKLSKRSKPLVRDPEGGKEKGEWGIWRRGGPRGGAQIFRMGGGWWGGGLGVVVGGGWGGGRGVGGRGGGVVWGGGGGGREGVWGEGQGRVRVNRRVGGIGGREGKGEGVFSQDRDLSLKDNTKSIPCERPCQGSNSIQSKGGNLNIEKSRGAGRSGKRENKSDLMEGEERRIGAGNALKKILRKEAGPRHRKGVSGDQRRVNRGVKKNLGCMGRKGILDERFEEIVKEKGGPTEEGKAVRKRKLTQKSANSSSWAVWEKLSPAVSGVMNRLGDINSHAVSLKRSTSLYATVKNGKQSVQKRLREVTTGGKQYR